MKYGETAVETQSEIGTFQETKTICRFNLSCVYYHVNLCKKIIAITVNL